MMLHRSNFTYGVKSLQTRVREMRFDWSEDFNRLINFYSVLLHLSRFSMLWTAVHLHSSSLLYCVNFTQTKLPEFNAALADHGLKHLRKAKVLKHADSPSADFIDEARSILNVSRATQFVWPPRNHSHCEENTASGAEEDLKSDSEVHGVHPMLTDPSWAPTFLSMATIERKAGLNNWELLIKSAERRYLSRRVNEALQKDMLGFLPDPSEDSEHKEAVKTESNPANAGDRILSIPLLAFLYLKVRLSSAWRCTVTNLCSYFDTTRRVL